MAVSGRKAASVRGPVSRGSAEDFEHFCEPCLTDDQHIEAFRYCVDCQEYLCKNCVRYHQKTKVLKHHQLLEKDKANKHSPATGSSETCTEICSTQKTDTHYKFERNKDINSMVSEQDVGYLSTIAETPVTTRKALALKYLIDSDINVRTKTDKNVCCITGCAVLSHEKLVLADRSNSKVKVVDIQTKVVNCDIKLDSIPWDVTVLSNGQVAVAVTNQKTILIMTISDQLKITRSVNVKKRCYGILCHEDSLFVLCHMPNSVLILDLQGKVKSTVPLVDGSPFEMAFCRDQKLLYISDCNSSSITSISLQGEVHAALKDDELGAPRGVLVLDDRSVLVCSRDNNCVYKLSGDLRQKQIVAENVKAPCCICYNEERNEVYIDSLFCDILKTFSVSRTC